MSADDYAAMSTERVLKTFAETAKRTGSLFSRSPEKLKPSSERAECVAAMHALGAALRARRPSEQDLWRLYDDRDPDVRSWASAQFASIDPEGSAAAFRGLIQGVSARDALALMRRARQLPPPKPTLEDMTVDELAARFEDATVREYGTHFLDCIGESQDMALRNRIRAEIWDIMRELKARGALSRLLPLLASPNMTVRREAATACLRIAEPQSVAALEDVAAKGKADDKFAAREALDEWRKNGSVVYGI